MNSHRRTAFYYAGLQALRFVTGTTSAAVMVVGKGLDQLDDVVIFHTRYQHLRLNEHRQRVSDLQGTLEDIEALPEAGGEEEAPA